MEAAISQPATAGPPLRNETSPVEGLSSDDAAWALTCAFLILTMQTGFAMLECGCVSVKNIANIMIKNVVDVSLGGLSYWIFGYGLSFGSPSNWFCGLGAFFFTVPEHSTTMGTQYSHYFFQFSFATTATTIVSGAVAERMKLHGYMVFSFVNTLVYCLPASWAWNTGDENSKGGFLYRLKFFDFAGVCIVHLTGGVSAFVAAAMLGPRTGRFEDPSKFQMNSPVTALTGMFMLWWAWLGFNCGSTFGVSGDLWKITALVAVTTLNGAIGGGCMGLALSMALKKGKVDIGFVVNSVLGGLVGITGVAPVTSPVEALVIGSIGGIIAIAGVYATDALRVDDPVGAVPVHMLAGIWGTISVGIFGRNNSLDQLQGVNGLFHHGGWYLLGIQVFGCSCIVAWSAVTTFCLLLCIHWTMGIRMSPEDEILGADWVEHDIHSEQWSMKLESTLGAIKPDEWNDIMTRLHHEIKGAETQRVDPQHRVFAVDTGANQGDAPPTADELVHMTDSRPVTCTPAVRERKRRVSPFEASTVYPNLPNSASHAENGYVRKTVRISHTNEADSQS